MIDLPLVQVHAPADNPAPAISPAVAVVPARAAAEYKLFPATDLAPEVAERSVPVAEEIVPVAAVVIDLAAVVTARCVGDRRRRWRSPRWCGNRPGGGGDGIRPDRPGGGGDGIRPDRPGGGDRPGRPGDNRPGQGGGGQQWRPGENGNWANHRPGQINNWNQWNNWRQNNFTNINNNWNRHWHDHGWNNWYGRDWWNRYPNIGWRYPGNFNYWGYAAWPALTSWFPSYGWTEPVYYSYGDNVYYDDDEVYYGTQPVATAAEYAQQAEAIATSVPEVTPAESDWMPLGVYAVTQDGEPSGADPTLFLQLAVSKQGIISGTLQNSATEQGPADRRHGRQANPARRLDRARPDAADHGDRHQQSHSGHDSGPGPLCRRLDAAMAAGATGQAGDNWRRGANNAAAAELVACS